MLKTIKTTKKMRLDELIKYIFDNDIVGKRFEERADFKSYSITNAVHVSGGGAVNIEGFFKPDITFTVEVEEGITEDTVFRWLLEVNDTRLWTQMDGSINDVKDGATKEIYAHVNGKLQLIWEAE